MARKINIKDLPVLDVKNEYDKFDLDFLQYDGDKIFNGEFDITNIPDRLLGVPTGEEEVNLVDYLGYRPVPVELLRWRDIPNVHPDSLDMEQWYQDIIDYSIE